jgi:UDP-N-acetylglucosamine 2-epimerase
MKGPSVRIAYALGTRPEVIRSSRILRLMVESADVELVLINSGQHYDRNMIGDLLGELDVPEIDVELAVGSSDAVTQTAAVMTGVGSALELTKPDALCVFGDTNSSLGAGLAAAKRGLPLVHVEAGCRSYDMTMPEEVNRRIIDHVGQLLLAVSDLGAENLEREAVPGRIAVVGDPLFDVFRERATAVAGARRSTRGLITLHRPENVDDPDRLRRILEDIDAASERAGLTWTFPVHPRTRGALPDQLPGSIEAEAPLGYAELLRALLSARVCVTDSGGLQKEAFWARVPCVTVRRSTEWLETVRAGANVLAQPGSSLLEALAQAAGTQLEERFENPFGDGHASERIVDTIQRWLAEGGRTRQ